MFAHLSKKPDQGLGQFRAMLQMLITWSHFDPYYFDKLKKLNRGDAERAISHLKQLQEIRITSCRSNVRSASGRKPPRRLRKQQCRS
jgi:hypothetical protein